MAKSPDCLSFMKRNGKSGNFYGTWCDPQDKGFVPERFTRNSQQDEDQTMYGMSEVVLSEQELIDIIDL